MSSNQLLLKLISDLFEKIATIEDKATNQYKRAQALLKRVKNIEALIKKK
ncbi:hypothetical protein LCGC14_0938050 [marine sediment metagenome]|uniref:Uncharacterized protein n=1 Tax=marine sediment metagenome TaxID=412755 RepID=A0A0F9NQH5_9ZZZZ